MKILLMLTAAAFLIGCNEDDKTNNGSGEADSWGVPFGLGISNQI